MNKKKLKELIAVEKYFSRFLTHAEDGKISVPVAYVWAHRLIKKEVSKLQRKERIRGKSCIAL